MSDAVNVREHDREVRRSSDLAWVTHAEERT